MTTQIGRFTRTAAVGTAVVAAMLLLAAIAPPRAAAQEEITVKGEILDLTCYLSRGSKGERHKTCAVMCAKKGLPIGILTESGQVYLLIEDHDDPDPYADAKKLAGQQAEISGKKYAEGGVAAIQVKQAKGI
jgi:hypothetical protein